MGSMSRHKEKEKAIMPKRKSYALPRNKVKYLRNIDIKTLIENKCLIINNNIIKIAVIPIFCKFFFLNREESLLLFHTGCVISNTHSQLY